SCPEINECSQVPQPCGPNTYCLNHQRSFSCMCEPGYRSSKGDSWLPGSVAPLNCSDIDECSPVPSVCDLHSSCVNTVGSYSCQCQPGYSSPGALCSQDIDECSQNSSICGLHSSCVNTLGNYSCQCKAGHSSPGGNSWKPGDNHTLNCTDIDECSQNSSICGLHSSCVNTLGNYSCQCKAGHSSYKCLCQDIDECSQNSSICGLHSSCVNTLGNYSCQCKAGHSSPGGNSWVMGAESLGLDIDECSQNSSICVLGSFCVNTAGSYSCRCHLGYSSPGGNSWKPDDSHTLNCTDIDECSQNSSICGLHSSCVNTLGNYSCQCKAGHSSPGGNSCFFKQNYIDECSPVPSVCDLHSSCVNTVGSYSCQCQPGYSSPGGNSWKPDDSHSLNCTVDIDECSQNSSICGLHSSCVNTLGNYSCQCNTGYSSPGGNSWKPGENHSLNCTDIDECSQNSSICGLHSSCVNTLGNYSCQCKAGHSSPGFDIDECSQNSSICGLHSSCVNTLGNYSCQCKAGHSSPGGNSCILNITTDKIPFSCLQLLVTGGDDIGLCRIHLQGIQESKKFCSFMKDIRERWSSALGNGSNPVPLQNATASFDSFVGDISELPPKEKVLAATVFLKSVESVAFEAALRSPMNQIKPIRTGMMTIAAKAVKDNCSSQGESISLNAKNEWMAIDCTTVVGSDRSGTGAVVFIVYDQLESVLKDSVSDQSLTGAERLNEVTLNSNVVSATIGKSRNLSRPFNFTLEHKETTDNEEKSICVFWDVAGDKGNWSKEGCELLTANSTHTTCTCDHMSIFSILVDRNASQEDGALSIITHVGLSISLLCLFLAILTFLLCRSLWNVSTSLHLQLCLCLFMANLLFLTGMDKAKDKIGCAVIAGLLHYLFLACFTWMFLEGLHLFLTVRNLKVVNYTSASRFKKRYMYPFGYGFPALIVAISAAVNSDGYGSTKHCWLETDNGFLWSFLGPVCLIILMNCTFFITTLWILRDKICSLNSDVSTVKNTRLLTFKAVAQLFILGCTWSFGLLPGKVMAYLFTIVNSLQGAFIFLVHCLLNRQVRAEYKRWIQRIEKPSTRTTTFEISMSAAPLNTGIV
uniref:Adhesion G protein-coupled receptor E1 n=1 Tax=Pelodiscus sinensis TaxID=13735 RepID=K7FVA0_PELSI